MVEVKSIFALLMVVLLSVLSSSVFAGTYSGGTGEPNNPYLIATAEDLNDIGNHSEDFDKHFLLIADINLAEYTDTQFNIIGNKSTRFSGVFDGNSYTISNFTYNSSGAQHVGLFGFVVKNAEIKNLVMENISVNVGNGEEIGGLVGVNNGMISNCHLTATVSAERWSGGLVGVHIFGVISQCSIKGSVNSARGCAGGLVGWNDGIILNSYAECIVSGGGAIGGIAGIHNYGSISNCYAAGEVSGDKEVGGLVGSTDMGNIFNCYADARVSANEEVGGLVGFSIDGVIHNCYSIGRISGNRFVGGLLGSNHGSVSSCYSIGDVNGVNDVGGLVGENYYSSISNCYSIGSVIGEIRVGGLVGVNHGSKSRVSNCYYAGDVNGVEDIGGLVGYHEIGSYTSCFWDIDINPDVNGIGNKADPNVVGLPTVEMQTESTFTDADWDFIEIWDIGENQTYPFLRTHPTGDINHNDTVNFYDLAILARHWLESID